MSRQDASGIYNLTMKDQHDRIDEGSRPEDVDERRHLENDVARQGSASGFKFFLKVLANPSDGWKALKRSKIMPDAYSSACFYPMLALVALSHFACYIYNPDAQLSPTLMGALGGFLKFFVGFFVIILLLRRLPHGMKELFNKNFGRNFLMTCLASLALFEAIIELFPIGEPILVFLPLYTIFIIFKGVRFLRVERDRETMTAIELSIATVAVPQLIELIFDKLMPGV